MSLAHAFKVRLCNFKVTGINNLPNAVAPFCLRGNFDGRVFNTEYFHGTGGVMSPMWSTDVSFEYNTPSLETLSSKFLVVECYGSDNFLGMCRLDLRTLATGPQTVQLNLRDGQRINGNVTFTAIFALISNVTIKITRLSLSNLTASREVVGDSKTGGEYLPNPYLTYGISDVSTSPVESAIAPNSTNPIWEQLPPMKVRSTFDELCRLRFFFDLKHSRNGYTASPNDPVMANFIIALSEYPIEPGRDITIPVRQMVHSHPQYSAPFSAELLGTIDLLNLHKLAQYTSGVITDDGIIGGEAAESSVMHTRPRSPPRADPSRMLVQQQQQQQQLQIQQQQQQLQRQQQQQYSTYSSQRGPEGGQQSVVMASPNKSIVSVQQPIDGNCLVKTTTVTTVGGVRDGQQLQQQQQPQNQYTTPGTGVERQGQDQLTNYYPASKLANISAEDVKLFERVIEEQSVLLSKVQSRLEDVRARRVEAKRKVESVRQNEQSSQRADAEAKIALEDEIRIVMSDRQRLEEALETIHRVIDEERVRATAVAAEHARARRALEEEEQEALAMQQEVLRLRDEMNAHANDEEHRYQIRIREAEDARRRNQQDSVALAALEQRLNDAESKISNKR